MKNLRLQHEVKYKTARSSGKGGQHVNKVETKVELFFNISESLSLTDEEKERIQEKLKNRISKEGILRLSCQKKRSQQQNKDLVFEKFTQLIGKALTFDKVRKPTKLPKSVKLKREKDKRFQSAKKALRQKDFTKFSV